MKRLIWILLTCAAFAQTKTTVIGNIQDPTGVIATSGYVQFDLTPASSSTTYYVQSTVVVASQSARCGIDASGNVKNLALSGACQVWGTGVITPANLTYCVTYAPNGTVSNRVCKQLITGANYDLTSPVFGPVVSLVPQYATYTTNGTNNNIVPTVGHVFNIGTSGTPYAAGYFDTVFITSGFGGIMYTNPTGSNTGGIAESYAACPSTGCMIIATTDITISTPQTLTIVANKPLVLNLAGHKVTAANTTGIGLTFTDANINTWTPFSIQNGELACSWTNSSLTGFKFSAATHVTLFNVDVRTCDHSGTAILWDDVQDSGMEMVHFMSNANALKLQNTSNQVSFHNVWFQQNVSPIQIVDSSDVAISDCLVQSSTGQKAVQVTTSIASQAQFHISRCHFENNGDTTSSSRNIYIAPTTAQSMLGISIEDSIFTAGTNGVGGTSLEIAGSGLVAPITLKNNQYNSYAAAKYVTGLNNANWLTSIGENGSTQVYDAALNSNGLPGVSFAPQGSTRQFQVFAGWPGNFNGFWQFWDVTNNFSLLNYNGGNNSWNIPNSKDLVGYSDANVTQKWKVVGTSGVATFAGGVTGVTTNSSASAGIIGEYTFNNDLATPVTLTTATIANLTSVSLTAGDWDVYAFVNFTGTSTTFTRLEAGIQTANNILAAPTADGGYTQLQFTSGTANDNYLTVGPFRVSQNGTATYYLNVRGTFASNTLIAGGTIRARRIR